MSRTDFPLTPELWEFGEELLKALTIRAVTQIARAERGESGGIVADVTDS